MKKKSEDMVTTGNMKEMELTFGKIGILDKIFRWKKHEVAGYIKSGYNNVQKMYFIQIAHRKSGMNFRIYMTMEEYDNFIYNCGKVREFTDGAINNNKNNAE